MAILLPTPHREKRAPGRAEEDKRNQEWSQVWMGKFPCAVCSEGHREQKVPFFQKRWMRVGRNRRKEGK